MSTLPFPFVAADFHPLQPEECVAEEKRRKNPKYAHLYRNLASELYGDTDSEGPTPTQTTNEYDAWVVECKRLDSEVEQAKSEWRQSVVKKDLITAQLREEIETARTKYRTLEMRVKPAQPRSARKK